MFLVLFFVVLSMSEFPIDSVAMKRSIETVLTKFIVTADAKQMVLSPPISFNGSIQLNAAYKPIQRNAFDRILENAYTAQWCIGYL